MCANEAPGRGAQGPLTRSHHGRLPSIGDPGTRRAAGHPPVCIWGSPPASAANILPDVQLRGHEELPPQKR